MTETAAHPRHVLTRPPVNRDELWHFVHALWGVQIPRQRVCPDHVSPFDAFCEGYFGNQPNWVLWYGSRGTGKSLLLALLALTKAVAMDINVVLLGGSMAQSTNVHEHVESLLRFEGAPVHAISRSIKTELLFHIGNWVRPIPASQTTVRGPHPHMTLLDEIDEMERAIYDAAQGQALRRPNARGHVVNEMTVASSTWQNPEGTFKSVMDEALIKGLPIRTWCIASGSMITTARGQVPIEEVANSDLVLTRQGFAHVQHVTFMGFKPTIRLDVGEVSLYATDDHLIATEDGFRHASALAADTVSPIRANPHVLRCELVPLTAMAGSNMAGGPSTGLVDADGHEVQVLDVDASPVQAQMVNGQAIINRPHYPQPDPAMGLHGGVSGVNALDPVAIALSARPVDAVSGEHGSTVLPVWDIGVEGAHEFVANGIVVHNCYREVLKTPANPEGWMDPEFIETKRQSVPAEMFRVEYDLGEPSGASRAFDLAKTSIVFTDIPLLEERHQPNDDLWIAQSPDILGSYVAGADWAKETDKTVIVVFRTDVEPSICVYLRVINRRSWPEMVDIFNKTLIEYHARAAHDATGVGNVVNDLVDERVLKVVMVDQKRRDLLNEYVADFESLTYRIPRAMSAAHDQHRATTMAMIWSGSTYASHLPDVVAACAIANRARRRMPPPVGGIGVPMEDYEPESLKPVMAKPRLDSTGDVEVDFTDTDEGVAFFRL